MSNAPLTVPEAIEQRRAVRAYTDAPVPDADLRRIVELAGQAPSAFNVQPWRFVAVRDPAVKQQLMAAANNQPQVGAAPVVIVLYSDMQDALATLESTVHPAFPAERGAGMVAHVRRSFDGQSDAAREAWGNAQANIALGVLLIAARSLGYATSPMLGFDPAAVKALLGLPAHVTIPALVAMGVGAAEGLPHHRHPLERVLRVV